jgi:hypothetical protein
MDRNNSISGLKLLEANLGILIKLMSEAEKPSFRLKIYKYYSINIIMLFIIIDKHQYNQILHLELIYNIKNYIAIKN